MSEIIKDSDNNAKHKASRRAILSLAAGGLPMVMTMKASARQAVNSALTCAFRLPSRYRVLVDDQGNAWANPTSLNINYRADRGGYRIDHITRFKNDSNTIPLPGAIFSPSFLPSACPIGVPAPSDNRQDCGFLVWRTNRNIDPSEFLNASETSFVGDFFDPSRNANSQNGIYVELSAALADAGATSGWPGISCIASIINSFPTSP
ncbi:hypothetical protein [Kordiimonas aquimaris]|uniref:hypothetical protein n=1 Tax=Kordiimonas aquimaris TaxID=707591 RepID=UPI0021CEF106|nr:hypothetical protein [Kordiimonas aquimaris]